MTAQPMADLLQVKELTKVFSGAGTFWSRENSALALDRVSFSLREGEALAVVGESGSGKTTLGRCILRLIEPTAGQIHFDGIDVRSLDAASMRRLRRRVQIIFQ